MQLYRFWPDLHMALEIPFLAQNDLCAIQMGAQAHSTEWAVGSDTVEGC
jgi:hypothetical protein